MPDNVKVLIAERNGVDLEFSEEHDLIPENLPYTNPALPGIDNVSDALDSIKATVGALIVSIPLIKNSTVSNNEFIGYNGLLANKAIVVPITGTFTGYTYTQTTSNATWSFEWRLNTKTATPFRTDAFSSTTEGDIEFVSPTVVTEGQLMFLKNIDQGSNISDVGIILKFKA